MPNGVYFLQLIATPFAYGSVYFDPLWALITLAISYFFGKYTFVFAEFVHLVTRFLQIIS
jgi:hypothetical protein